MSSDYAGDLSPTQAWEMLAQDRESVLIDVRTEAEWAWVGQVDLNNLGKKHVLVEWNHFPGGIPNGDFVGEVKMHVADTDKTILLLCRSGVRSKHAAMALTAAGFKTCYNIAGGFEGDHDSFQHRGQVNGWKFEGLPWAQG